MLLEVFESCSDPGPHSVANMEQVRVSVSFGIPVKDSSSEHVDVGGSRSVLVGRLRWALYVALVSRDATMLSLRRALCSNVGLGYPEANVWGWA